MHIELFTVTASKDVKLIFPSTGISCEYGQNLKKSLAAFWRSTAYRDTHTEFPPNQSINWTYIPFQLIYYVTTLLVWVSFKGELDKSYSMF